MRNRLSSVFVLLILALLVGSAAMAQNININNRHSEVNSCSDLQVTFDDHPAVRAEQHIDIPRAQVSELEITASHNGGIEVASWDRDDYGVTLCKMAGAGSEGESQKLLAGINLVRNGAQLSVTGPGDSQHWAAYLLVKAPKGAALNLHSSNGPISLRKVNGTAKLEAHNGPIQLEGCTGTFTASAQNGPIQMAAASGAYDLKTQNGPISLKFRGTQWEGGAVTASAQNGPVQMTLPAGWQSAFSVEGSYAPISCRADVCSKAQKTSEDGLKRIVFGNDPKIKASSHNGPISVHNANGEL